MRNICLVFVFLWAVAACDSAAETPSASAEIPLTPQDPVTDISSSAVEIQNKDELAKGIIFAIELTSEDQKLVQIDSATAEKQTLFTVPDNAWLSSLDYQPQREQFVLAFAPAPPPGEIQFGFTHLYLWRRDEPEPTLLLESGEGDHHFFNPVWSPDGQAIYYSHVEPLDVAAYTFTTSLKRYQLASGVIDVIAENGIWPALSPDGQQLAYITIDPDTNASTMMLANSDGQNKVVLLEHDRFAAVDAPVFSQDGTTITFSAADAETGSRPWWEIVLGIQTAAAHNLPSDWYRLPLSGGDFQRLTEIEAVGLYGRFAPGDKSTFAFASQNGMFTMASDGENLTLVNDGSFKDSMAWGP